MSVKKFFRFFLASVLGRWKQRPKSVGDRQKAGRIERVETCGRTSLTSEKPGSEAVFAKRIGGAHIKKHNSLSKLHLNAKK